MTKLTNIMLVQQTGWHPDLYIDGVPTACGTGQARGPGTSNATSDWRHIALGGAAWVQV